VQLLVPVVALIFSTFLEGFTWSHMTFAGLALVLLGNLSLVSKKKDKNTNDITVVVEEVC